MYMLPAPISAVRSHIAKAPSSTAEFFVAWKIASQCLEEIRSERRCRGAQVAKREGWGPSFRLATVHPILSVTPSRIDPRVRKSPTRAGLICGVSSTGQIPSRSIGLPSIRPPSAQRLPLLRVQTRPDPVSRAPTGGRQAVPAHSSQTVSGNQSAGLRSQWRLGLFGFAEPSPNRKQV